jgi:hypothetical protein
MKSKAHAARAWAFFFRPLRDRQDWIKIFSRQGAKPQSLGMKKARAD